MEAHNRQDKPALIVQIPINPLSSFYPATKPPDNFTASGVAPAFYLQLICRPVAVHGHARP